MTEGEGRDGLSTDERGAIRRALHAAVANAHGAATLEALASELRRVLCASSVAAALRPSESGALEFVAVAGSDPREIVGLRVAVEDTLADAALRSNEPALLQTDDVAGGRGGAFAPIPGLEGPAGALYAMGKDDGSVYGADDLSVMAIFAEVAGVAVRCGALSREIAEKRRELSVLYEAARTVTSSLNIQAVLDSVVDAVCNHLPYQAAALYLLNDERTHLFITADRGLNDEEREVQLSADAGLAGQVLESGEPLMVADAMALADPDALSAVPHTRAAMIAPIRSATETMGLLMVTSAQPRAFSTDDLRLLGAVAAQAGIAIENATLYEEATRRTEAATALYNLSQRAGSTLATDEVLNYVVDNAVALLQVDKFAAMLMNHRDGRLEPRAMHGLDPSCAGRLRPRPNEGIPGWVYAWMAPTAVADVPADSRNRSGPIHPEGVVSCLCVPMAAGDVVIGVLLAMSTKRRLFTVAEMELLYTIANQAAVAVINAEAFERERARARAMRRYLRRLASALGATLDRSGIVRLVADMALDVLDADRCAIYRLRDDVLILESQSSLSPGASPDASIPVGEGLTGWVAKRGRSLVVPVLSDDPRTAAHGWAGREQVASYLGLPLKAGRKTTGVLELLSREPRTFPPDEVRLLSQFASRARIGERFEEDRSE